MIDYTKIEEIKKLDTKESKEKLSEYGSTLGADLKKNKSFENMLKDLEDFVKDTKSEETLSDDESDAPDESDLKNNDNDDESIDEADEDSGDSPDESEEISVTEDDTENSSIELVKDSEFKPAFSLAFYNAMKMQRSAQVGYWITDEIEKLGDDWKNKIEKARYKKELYTILHYITKYGSVTLRESRNGRFITYK